MEVFLLCLFYAIGNFVSYSIKTLRGIALRRQGGLSQATPPQAEHFVWRNAFLLEKQLHCRKKEPFAEKKPNTTTAFDRLCGGWMVYL